MFGVSEHQNIKDLVRVKEIPTIFYNGIITEDFMVLLNKEYGIFGNYSENVFSLQTQDTVGHSEFPGLRLGATKSSSVITSLRYNDFSSFAGRQIFNNRKIENPFVVKKYEYRKDINASVGNYSSLKYPFGDNIFSILQTNKDLRKEAEELFIEYGLEFLYDSREQEFTILKRTNSGIFTVPYELVADTLQRLIFFKAAIYSNNENILLFEEPEAHMFPPYMRKYTTDVIFNQGNQFFITTHSPYILDAFIENASKELSLYLVYYEGGETKVKVMNDDDLSEIRNYGVDLFYNLESYLKRHGQVNNA